MDEEQSQPDEADEAHGAWPGLESALDEREGPAATADNLRGILVRHSKRRRRLTSGIAATVLALGLGGGVAIGELVTSTGGQLAASSPAAGGRNTAVAPPLALAKPSTHEAQSDHGLQVFSGNAAKSQALNPAAGSTSVGAGSGGGAKSNGAMPQPLCPQVGNCSSFGIYSLNGPMTRLFDRTANGVTIRAFTTSFGVAYPLYPGVSGGSAGNAGSGSASSGSAGSGSAASGSAQAAAGSTTQTNTGSAAHAAHPVRPICSTTEELVVEVSNAGAVGQIEVPSPTKPSSGIAYIDDETVGSAEGSPIAVVAVRVGAGAATVEARFGTGQYDEMTVVRGWAVLATSIPSSTTAASGAAVNVVVLNSSNKKISQVNISQAPSYAIPAICVGVVPVNLRPPVGTSSSPPSFAPNKPASAPSGLPTTVTPASSGNKTHKSK